MMRTLPWNQLGTDIEAAATVGEALALADLNWNVKSNPVFDANGNTIPGFYANTRDTDGEVLGIVGQRYQIVQNMDAFEFIDALVSNGIQFIRAGVFHHGRAVWVLGKLPEHMILGDQFDPYVVFINSHDGTGSIKICMTPIRIACSNALNLALKSASRTWSTRHMGDIQYKLQEARHTLGMANNYMIGLNQDAEKLALKQFDDVQFERVFDKLFPINPQDSKRKIQNIVDMKDGMFKALQAPDLANFNGSAWKYINAVTDYIDHADPARLTANFAENRWQKIATGHQIVDAFFEEIAA